ncbi:hypothetical protein HBI56_073150 [Parastagonospora nodorum]|uniref:Uncharacterized protein n=1 Tax=Phaeosphaeria nodorum (strain SN15 / ATCC MYA-4574 / FGSC 10173) TaxID=321614 RepID=A0A7U2I079_PHANO|nr:hypothetical protein HBH56_171840 [Parastagonospora nodorum]QRC94557.1 hypothetical protein JI435_305590 [Parastagonospora nodorum SN15]KAH3928332.1 hypothetical protein HBH54_140400 [Parastagonospora nodorum]KAH3945517.1 hypothetical protein HBH53_145720 [Parastagonospora nodorum]KAH3983618.1 hypothetical protein HBH52_058470 [Parastagonospora nodorum]
MSLSSSFRQMNPYQHRYRLSGKRGPAFPAKDTLSISPAQPIGIWQGLDFTNQGICDRRRANYQQGESHIPDIRTGCHTRCGGNIGGAGYWRRDIRDKTRPTWRVPLTSDTSTLLFEQ